MGACPPNLVANFATIGGHDACAKSAKFGGKFATRFGGSAAAGPPNLVAVLDFCRVDGQ